MLFSDLALSRRLERAEGLANMAYVEARARAIPGSNAGWTEIGGTRCMFDTPDSPVTQTFGLGLFEPVTAAIMDEIERFFQNHGAPVWHEVSPLADASALALLNERGYEPLEFTTMLVQEIHPGPLRETACVVRRAEARESAAWAQLAKEGWAAGPELAGFFEEFGAIAAVKQDMVSFFAEVDGKLSATGALNIHGDIALMAGASTVPQARGRGAQQSLLAYRLHYAAQHGCSLAQMGALPGSASQRNAQRNGFEIAYTRIKWRLQN